MMIAVIPNHHHLLLVTHHTVDHDHGGVRNPSLQKRPRSHLHGGGEVEAVIRTTPRTVGGRNHRHERIVRIGGRRVVVEGVTVRIVVEVAAVTAPMTPGRPADERPRKGPPPVKEPPPSRRPHGNPRLKSTTPAMPIRECAPSTPTFVCGESHVWGDGGMCCGNARRVLRRRRRSLVIMQVVLVG